VFRDRPRSGCRVNTGFLQEIRHPRIFPEHFCYDFFLSCRRNKCVLGSLERPKIKDGVLTCRGEIFPFYELTGDFIRNRGKPSIHEWKEPRRTPW